MDEPTASLDPELKQDVIKIIKLLNKRGLCVIVITHDMDVAKSVADTRILISQGRCKSFAKKRKKVD